MSNNHHLLKEYKPKLNVRIFLVILALLGYATKVFLASVYNKVLENAETITEVQLVWIGVTTAAVIVLLGCITFSKRVMEQKSKQKIIKNLQEKLIMETQDMNLVALEKIEEGKWMTLVSEDVEMCAGMFSEYHEPLIVGLVTFSVSLIIGAFLSWKMILVVIMCSAFSVFIPKLFVSKIEKVQQSKMEEKENINNNVIRPLFHKELISIFQYENICSDLYKKSYKRYADESIKEEKYYSAMIGTNIGTSFTVATIWMIVGVYFLSKGAINIGIFAAFMMLNDYFSWPFTELGELIAKRKTVYISEERVNDFLHTEKEKVSQLPGENDTYIQFRDVKYKYDDQYCLCVGNFKCRLGHKDWIAITGESGSGKTTLAKLMIGAYNPSVGTAEINYRNEKISHKIVAECFSFLPQSSLLLDETIEENIRIGNPDASDEEIKEVVRLTCLDGTITNLPEGYHTLIGQDSPVRLSGGQLARLGLARVLLKKSPIYILDEFSAELDIELEQKILSNLKELDAVFIFITHREATIKSCNKRIEIKKMELGENNYSVCWVNTGE